MKDKDKFNFIIEKLDKIILLLELRNSIAKARNELLVAPNPITDYNPFIPNITTPSPLSIVDLSTICTCNLNLSLSFIFPVLLFMGYEIKIYKIIEIESSMLEVRIIFIKSFSK